jgi:hypothetical protein
VSKGTAQTVSVEARLDDLEKLIREGGQREALARQEAERRFKTTGELALPMSVSQVAMVLNSTVGSVHVLVSEGELVKRFGFNPCAYHPDDVRAFLESRRAHEIVR